jgi:hypothetical protein
LGTLTEKEIWNLRKAVEFALFRVLMGASGRGLVVIFKFIMSNKNEAEGLSFSRNGGVTYVTGHGVTKQWSYADSDPDFCTVTWLAAHYVSLLQLCMAAALV